MKRLLLAAAIAILFLANAFSAYADTTVPIPSPCSGTLRAQSPTWSGTSVYGASFVNCANSVSGKANRVELWYYYRTVSTWRLVKSNETVFSGLSSVVSIGCASTYVSGGSYSWKTVATYDDGTIATNVATISYKKGVC